MIRERLVEDLIEYTGKPEEDVRKLMNEAAAQAEKKWSKGERDRFYEDHRHYVYELTHWHTQFEYRLQWTEQLVEFAKQMNLQSALDFGCGIGTDGLSLAELGLDVDLFDVGADVKKYVQWKINKYKLYDNAKLVNASGTGYDLVTIVDVIGHVEEPIDLIVELAQRTQYMFYTEDFNIGIAAYPMHYFKPPNFDRVFKKAFRHLGSYFYESRLYRPRVSIVPSLRAMGAQEGGVKRQIEALYRYLPTFGIDVVESECDFANVHATATHPRMLVHNNHGFYPWDTTDPVGIGANARLKQAVSLCNRTIAVSKMGPRVFEPRLKVKATILPNGVSPEEFDNVPQGYFAAKHYLERPFLLWAKLHAQGVCDPSPALRLAARMPNVQFAFTVVNTQPTNNVRVVGPLPYSEMRCALKDCTVLLATTKENFSVQVLEAMACGKPVLCMADEGGNSEAVVHKVTGYVAKDEEDLLRGALYCLANAERLGRAGRQRVEELYRWDLLVPKFATVFKEAQLVDLLAERCPLVSVIVPAYNAADTIAETLDSIFGQTLKDYEVIVVDDASTDNTQAVVAKYGDKVKYIRHFANSKVAKARNTGISQAKGKYIVCIDADDKMRPPFLEQLSKVLEEDNSVGLAYPDFELFGDAKGVVHLKDYDFEALKQGNFIPHCAMFRRFAWERVGGFKDINPSWEDYEFWLNLGKHGFYGKHVADALFLYRKRKGVGRDFESQGVVHKLRGIVNSYHPDLYPVTVSVIIPCFNHAHYLKDSIGSVMNQTFQQFEIIVVDDGSSNPDEVATAAQQVAGSRAKVIRHETNRGLAEARNTGVRASKGKYVLTLDADDMIKPTFLETTVAMLDTRSDVAIAYTDIELFGAVSVVQEMPEYDFELLLKKDLMTCTSLYRREVFDKVGGYDPRMNIAWEDYLFWIRAGKLGFCGARINVPLFMYRRDRPSMIIQAQSRIAEVRKQLYDLEPELFKEGKRPVGCCGRRAGTSTTGMPGRRPVNMPAPAPAVNGVGDVALVEVTYVGTTPQMGVRGLVTGAFYEFKRNETKFVDGRDAVKLIETGLFQ